MSFLSSKIDSKKLGSKTYERFLGRDHPTMSFAPAISNGDLREFVIGKRCFDSRDGGPDVVAEVLTMCIETKCTCIP